MTSKIITLLAVSSLGINILIPRLVFGQSAEGSPQILVTPEAGTPQPSPEASAGTATPTPFQSYSQKKHILFNSTGSQQQSELSNNSAMDALNQATAPLNTLVKGIFQMIQKFNYSSIKFPAGINTSTTSDNTSNTVEKVFKDLGAIKGNLSGQEALLGIKDVFLFTLKLFLTVLEVLSQIIKWVLGLFN